MLEFALTKSLNGRSDQTSVCQRKTVRRRSSVVRTLPTYFVGRGDPRVEVGGNGSANNIYRSKGTMRGIWGACGVGIGQGPHCLLRFSCTNGLIIPRSGLCASWFREPLCIPLSAALHQTITVLCECCRTISGRGNPGPTRSTTFRIAEFDGDDNAWEPFTVIP